jgi:choice-of-anchor B domain-containing protein
MNPCRSSLVSCLERLLVRGRSAQRSALLFLGIFLLAAGLVRVSYAAQGSRTVPLLGRFGNLGRDTGYSGVWGYVDPGGGEYALLGTRRGTSIVDVNDPANPVEVAFIPGRPSNWREIQTFSTYAYVTTEAGGGVQIIDLSGLPKEARLVNTYNATVNNAHTLFIDRAAGYAYINGATQTPSTSRGGLAILDLNSDPVFPVPVGVYSTRYVHDSFVRDDIAYTSELGNGFSLVDVSDKSNPRVLARRAYSGSYTHNGWLTEDGAYFLTTDEITATPRVPGGRLRVWDIRDVNNIFQAGEYTTHPQATIHNVHVRGDFAYASYYAEGLRIIDMTDPTLPAEAGFFDTHPEWVTGQRGTWGVYPFLPSGTILISDIETGLWVFSFDGTYAGRLRGVVTDADTGQAIAGATVRLEGNNAPVATDSDGAYGIGHIPDTYTLTVSRPGYRPFKNAVTLMSGKTIYLNVELAPESSK